MTDQHYFERRLAEELDAATASADPLAAAAHLALAQAYLLRLEWAQVAAARPDTTIAHCRRGSPKAPIRGGTSLLS